MRHLPQKRKPHTTRHEASSFCIAPKSSAVNFSSLLLEHEIDGQNEEHEGDEVIETECLTTEEHESEDGKDAQ